MLPGAVAAYVVIGPVVATPPAVWRPMDAARGAGRASLLAVPVMLQGSPVLGS